jgi:hypothetical protein
VDFTEGHELGERVDRIPAGMIGRMLSVEEARKLVRHLERAPPDPKRPPTPSVRTRKVRAARASTQ